MRPCRIVISRNGLSDPKRQEFEEKLAEKCAADGLQTLVMPHLYHLYPDAAGLSTLREIEEPIIFFSWLYPRAAFWLLRKIGVKGVRSETLGATPFPEDERPIVCFNMSDKCCPDRWIEQIEKLLGGKRSGKSVLGGIERVDGRVEERWYPVIDYDRCTNCQECMEFCLFGVYAADEEGRISAAVPDACKPGCPACSRVCRRQAIMFPLHESDAAIAGSDEGDIQPFQMDSGLIEGLKRKYREGKVKIEDVVRACGCDTKSGPLPPKARTKGDASCCPAESSDKPRSEDNDRGYFDRLIDSLLKD